MYKNDSWHGADGGGAERKRPDIPQTWPGYRGDVMMLPLWLAPLSTGGARDNDPASVAEHLSFFSSCLLGLFCFGGITSCAGAGRGDVIPGLQRLPSRPPRPLLPLLLFPVLPVALTGSWTSRCCGMLSRHCLRKSRIWNDDKLRPQSTNKNITSALLKVRIFALNMRNFGLPSREIYSIFALQKRNKMEGDTMQVNWEQKYM